MRSKIMGLFVLLLGFGALFLSPSPSTALGQGSSSTSAPLQATAVTNQQTISSDQNNSASDASTSGTSASVPTPTSAPALEPKVSDGADTDGQDKLDKQIKAWVQTLSKEKEFTSWIGAEWVVYPLGPGTHSWVVIVRKDTQEVGYLVISAVQDGSFELSEYGSGEKPLFSLRTLYQSLVQHELISNQIPYSDFVANGLEPLSLSRIYQAPLQGVWMLKDGQEARYLDAKTGQELPDISAWVEQLNKDELSSPNHESIGAGALPSSSIVSTTQWTPVDPFLHTSWLKGSPLKTATFSQWKKAAKMAGGSLVYSGRWYLGNALYPLAVSGVQEWTDHRPYIRLELEGSRYVPYQETLTLGDYYK